MNLLKFIAYKKRVPMAELIREAIARFIHEESVQKESGWGTHLSRFFTNRYSHERHYPKNRHIHDAVNIARNGGFGMRFDILRDFACRDYGEPVRPNAYVAHDEEKIQDRQRIQGKDPTFTPR